MMMAQKLTMFAWNVQDGRTKTEVSRLADRMCLEHARVSGESGMIKENAERFEREMRKPARWPL